MDKLRQLMDNYQSMNLDDEHDRVSYGIMEYDPLKMHVYLRLFMNRSIIIFIKFNDCTRTNL